MFEQIQCCFYYPDRGLTLEKIRVVGIDLRYWQTLVRRAHKLSEQNPEQYPVLASFYEKPWPIHIPRERVSLLQEEIQTLKTGYPSEKSTLFVFLNQVLDHREADVLIDYNPEDYYDDYVYIQPGVDILADLEAITRGEAIEEVLDHRIHTSPTFCIVPHKGFNDIAFGMTRDEVRHALKDLSKNVEDFNKGLSSGDKNFKNTDAYRDLGFFVYYKPDNTCEAIEFFPNYNKPRPFEPTLDGKRLFGLSYKEIKKQFKKLDPELEVDGMGFTSYKFGVGFYFDCGDDDPKALVEAVIIFPKGYYDKKEEDKPIDRDTDTQNQDDITPYPDDPVRFFPKDELLYDPIEAQSTYNRLLKRYSEIIENRPDPEESPAPEAWNDNPINPTPFRIIPRHGTDRIGFGMTREEVRWALRTLTKTVTLDKSCSLDDGGDSEFYDTDCFKNLGVHVIYREFNATCKAIKLFQPAEAFLDDTNLLGLTHEDMTVLLKKADPNLAVGNMGHFSDALGLKTSYPSVKENPDALPESILLFAVYL
jgi:hypothetical protein